MKAHTAISQATMTPGRALEYLKEGNLRFQNNLKAHRNLLEQVNETSEGQFPFAVVLSCIDSRTSAELIFDQGLGDIFSIRIAGNFINEDILGSMEFACAVAGSKLVVVLGHSHCGAVTAACKGGGDGHIATLLKKIEPAVNAAASSTAHSKLSEEFVDEAARIHVQMTVEEIRKQSARLAQLEKENKIGIVGGVYDVRSGVVDFFE